MIILKEIRPIYIVMLLFSGVALLYYPSLIDIFYHPSVFSIDDANLMNHILNHQLQMDEVFSPRGSGKYFINWGQVVHCSKPYDSSLNHHISGILHL